MVWDSKEHYQKNKVRIRKTNRERMAKRHGNNLDMWEGFIPHKTDCEVCGRKIYFHSRHKHKAIHFDHKTGKEPIDMCPTHWLRKTVRTKETEELWNECNFGMLCYACNLRLPTEDRINFMKKAFKYVMRGSNVVQTLS